VVDPSVQLDDDAAVLDVAVRGAPGVLAEDLASCSRQAVRSLDACEVAVLEDGVGPVRDVPQHRLQPPAAGHPRAGGERRREPVRRRPSRRAPCREHGDRLHLVGGVEGDVEDGLVVPQAWG